MRYLILLLLVIAGCTPIDAQVLVGRDAWTGAHHVTVQEREIYRDGDAILTVRPVVFAKDGTRAFGVLTHLRRRDANGPRIDRITSLGHTLRYQRIDRLFTHCIDGCQPAETGVVWLSAETFAAAARSGLPLRVWGQRGRAEGVVPPEAFQKVLAHAPAH